MSRILQIGLRIAIVLAILVVATLLAVFLAFRVGLYVGQPPPDELRALTEIRLVDATEGPAIEEATVVIDGDEIAEAGPADEVDIPEQATVHRLEGHTVVPGLIDGHLHLGGPQLEEGQSLDDVGLVPMVWEAFRQAPSARKGLIESGVTTIGSPGDSDDWIVGVRESIRDHDIEGPTIVTSGPILTAPGGHPAGTLFEGNEFLIDTATRQIADPDQARETVAEVDELGVDFVKIVIDSGADDQLPTLDAETVEAIVDEASARDLDVRAHWRDADDLEVALQAGVDGLDHPGHDEISDDHLETMVQRDVALTPTLAVFEAAGEQLPEAGAANTVRLAEAGGRVVAGTDAPMAGLKFGPGLHRELQVLVEAGLTPRQALRAATVDAATHLGIEDRVGTVEPGKKADLVVLGADPLEDISAIREVEMVFRDGKILVDEPGLSQ